MKRLLTCVALVGALALGARSVLAQVPEGRKGPPATLSAAAQKAIKAAFPNATVGTVSMTGSGEWRLFSVPLTEGDKKFTAHVSDSGIIVRVTTHIADLTTLPKAVTDAVNAASAGAKITSATTVERRTGLIPPFPPREKARMDYEIGFIGQGGAPNSMEVSEDGTVVRPPRAPKTAPKPAPTPAQPS